MSKVLEMLDFLTTPKTMLEVKTKFGKYCVSNMRNLISRGAVRMFEGAVDNSEGRYVRTHTEHYVATGKPYITRVTRSQP